MTEDNINTLFDAQYRVLGTLKSIWDKIPDAIFTQEVFDTILEYVRETAPEQLENQLSLYLEYLGEDLQRFDHYNFGEQGIDYLRALFNPAREEDNFLATTQRDFNHAQSTHEPSVHRTVSESAIKLKTHYGKNIKSIVALNSIVAEITKFVDDLSSGNKNNAVKRCIKVITADQFNYYDQASQVTTRQLLGLVWLAIHDKEKRIGSLDDAKKMFTDGLYEIERGYNISLEGVDQGGRDLRVCVRGTFNKIMEKLDGVHPDVHIEFVTIVNASWKLKAVVNEELKSYLTQYQQAHSEYELSQKIEAIESKGIEVIWPEIKGVVANRLYDEFGKCVFRGCRDEKFNEFLSTGIYVNVEKLDVFKSRSASQFAASLFSPASKSDSECPRASGDTVSLTL